MRLTSIKLAGFKSFVDLTTVSFPSNLAAIVGPNGSGKSNLIDAVRWVMGESSAKYLRGESMADVIFNGSTARKPVGQASIELLFDNTEGKLGGEYANFSQIAVKRVVTRDGQSVYLLNGSRCRRRDITDLFLGTGLGPRSYAIIMQDTISRLIEAKPEELRIYLEEAAGISKYKERRRETETRMQHTRENLDRLTDLREELGKQINHLQRQAKAAERYKELREELRLVKAQLLALRWRSIDEELQARTSQIRDSEVAVEAAVSKLRSIDTDFERQQQIQSDSSEILNAVQEKYYGLSTEIARLEQSKQHQLERQNQLQIDYQHATNAVTQAEQELTRDEQQLTQLDADIRRIEPESAAAKIAADTADEKQKSIEKELHQWQSQWDEFNQLSARTLQQAEVAQTRIQHIEQRQNESRRRLEQLLQEKAQINFSSIDDSLQQLIDEINTLKSHQEQQQKDLDSTLADIQVGQQQQQKLNQELHLSQSLMQQLSGKQSSLEALQQVALGQNDKDVMHWLKQQNLAARPRLAEILRVDPGWERAVELVLSNYLEAVCVEELASASEKIEELRTGNLSLLSQPKGAKAANTSNSRTAATLALKVSGDATTEALLANVYLADSLTEALEIAKSLQSHQSVITQSGLWLGNGWLRLHLANDQKAGVLQRQHELDQIKQQIINANETIVNLQRDLNNTQEKLQSLDEVRNQLQQQLRQTMSQISQLGASQQVKQAERNQLDSRLNQVSQGIDDTQQLLAKFDHELAQVRHEWQQALSQAESHTTQREHLSGLRDNYREQLDSCRKDFQQQKDRAHQLALQYQAAKSQYDGVKQAQQRAQTQLTGMQQRCVALQNQLNDLQSPIDVINEQLTQKLAERMELEKELQTAREAAEVVEQKIRSLTKDRHQAEAQVEQSRQALENIRLQAQSLQVKRATLEEQMEETQFILAELLPQLTDDISESINEQKVEDLERRIARLGPINLAAIEEYASVSERKVYLDAQDADLVSALTMLEDAIRKIDRETRQRFKETYDTVNEHFQALFPKIFGGGNAYLELSGDDLLETGVSVMARPPGKRNSTIHLLSGGEKALTAMALVFSLFQLNPAPFCMLDEVDAPLDDANVGRFCSLVKEMSKSVQFIFISHNKLAIEMADHLIGVTMREPGVSRLVAVDIAEAVAMAGA